MIEPIKAPGQITISRPHGGRDEKCITISIEDESSGCLCVEISVPLAAFAEALTGLACQPCDCRWTGGLNHIGQIREHKVEEVFVPDCGQFDKTAVVAAALAPYEVSGWVGSRSDATNHHCWIQRKPISGREGHYYRVGFSRFVDAPVKESRE